MGGLLILTRLEDSVEVQSSHHPPPRMEFVYPYELELVPEREWEVDGRKVKLPIGWRLLKREVK
jgi:hypothetical protein